MVTDYEAAYVGLLAYVASKPQHGRADLLVKAAELADAHRVPAGELERLLRLYGVEVARARAVAAHHEVRDETATFAGGTPSPADPDLPGHDDRGGHDGSDGSAGPAGRDGDGAGARGGDRLAA